MKAESYHLCSEMKEERMKGERNGKVDCECTIRAGVSRIRENVKAYYMRAETETEIISLLSPL